MARLDVRRRLARRLARLRSAVVPAAALVLALSPAVAAAGRVVQVRIGQHEGFTRVVFDLDETAAHRVVQSMRDDAKEIVVEIDAATTNRRVLSKSELVESVTLAPDGPTSTIARIALRGARVQIEPKRYDAPARIVIDLRPSAAGTTSATASTRGAAAPALAATAEKTTSERELAGESEEAVGSATEPSRAPALAAPRSLADAGAEAAQEEAAGAAAEASAPAAAAAPAAQPEAEEVAAVAEREPPAGSAPGGPGTASGTAGAGAEPQRPAAAAPSTATPSTVASATPPAPITPSASGLTPAAPDVAGAPTQRLPEGLDLRVLIVGVVAVLSVFLLWGVVGRRDRTSHEVAEELAAPAEEANAFADRDTSPWEAGTRIDEGTAIELADESGAEPEPVVTAEPEPEIVLPPAAPVISTSGQAELPLARGGESAGAAEASVASSAAVAPAPQRPASSEEATPAVADRTAPRLVLVPTSEPAAAEEAAPAAAAVAATTSAIAAVSDAASAASVPAEIAAAARVRELEERIAQLERRLEDAADSRERMERALVAQNEELRVQRAAIARTQRVLRSIAKPEDLGIDPVTRGPGGVQGS